MRRLAGCLTLLLILITLGGLTATAGASPWKQFPHAAPFDPGAMLLLTDGSVLVQDQGPMEGGSGHWWRLVPNDKGSYLDGTWHRAGSLPAGYGPLYFASAVLPDGRVIIAGGEFNFGDDDDINRAAIYDPQTNRWQAVAPPDGGSGEWSRIGDAPSTVLANGTFMLGASGYSGTTAEALLNARTLSWTATGAGKADGNGEEGWSLLPDGQVLTVDAKPGSCSTSNTEIYTPATGAWSTAGTTPDPLIDCTSGEVGPQLLTYDGTVFAEGSTGANAIYHIASGTWTAGPRFPVIGGRQYVAADAASAILPNGDVLLNASPGTGVLPTHFFVFDGTRLTQVADDADAAHESSNYGNMLVLPTGQVLFDYRLGPRSLEIYDGPGSPKRAWRPRITSVPKRLGRGRSYTVSGVQLNGLTQGSAYGDDYQSATNYPLVRITNDKTHHVVYARTSDMSSMTVAPGARSSARFTLGRDVQTGRSSFVVVANGVASASVKVDVTR